MTRSSAAPTAFEFLTALASRRERIAYSDFAFDLGLGSPRNLGWLLSPMLGWCRDRGLPWLPIIVVRRADGLPSGGYEPRLIEAETERVFDHDWSAVTAPTGDDLALFALAGA